MWAVFKVTLLVPPLASAFSPVTLCHAFYSSPWVSLFEKHCWKRFRPAEQESHNADDLFVRT